MSSIREILFRGKCLDSNAWHESPCPLGTMLAGVIRHDFDPTTVGQYTGLTDKNGVRIFEGDIVRTITPNTKGCYPVKFEFGQFCIGINMPIAWGRDSCEVIGNIHDTPGTLGGGTLKREQHQQFLSLKEKLAEVLEHEPLYSGDEYEDCIWARANDLKALLDDFFGQEEQHENR